MKTLIRVITTIIIVFLVGCTSIKIDSTTAHTFWGLPYQTGSGVVYYQEVENEFTKKQNYEKAKKWIYDNARSPKDIIQVEDEQSGYLMITPEDKLFWNYGFGDIPLYMKYRVEFECEDSLRKITVSQFRCRWWIDGDRYNPGRWAIRDLEEFISIQSNNKKKFIDMRFKPWIRGLGNSLSSIH